MLTVTPFSVKKDANKNHILPAKEEKEEVCHSLLDEDGEPHSEDQKHRDKCNICQSKVRHRDAMANELWHIDTSSLTPWKTNLSQLENILTLLLWQVVKPIVETDISRAASSFAKDSTLIKYR